MWVVRKRVLGLVIKARLVGGRCGAARRAVSAIIVQAKRARRLVKGLLLLLEVQLLKLLLDHLALGGCSGRCNVNWAIAVRATIVDLVQDVWVQMRS